MSKSHKFYNIKNSLSFKKIHKKGLPYSVKKLKSERKLSLKELKER